MAFITTGPFHRKTQRFPDCRKSSLKRIRLGLTSVKCLARSHPFDNGCIPQKIDWTGYDPEGLAKEVEEAKRLLEETPVAKDQVIGRWVMLVNPRFITMDSRLYDETMSAEKIDLKFRDEFVMHPLLDGVVKDDIDKRQKTLWTIQKENADEKYNLDVFQPHANKVCQLTLNFARRKEADLYFNELDERRKQNYQVIEKDINVIRSEAEQFDYYIAFILPNSVFSPSFFER